MTTEKHITLRELEAFLAPITASLDGMEAVTTVVQHLGEVAGTPAQPVWMDDAVADGLVSAMSMLSHHASDACSAMLEAFEGHAVSPCVRAVEPWTESDESAGEADITFSLSREGRK